MQNIEGYGVCQIISYVGINQLVWCTTNNIHFIISKNEYSFDPQNCENGFEGLVWVNRITRLDTKVDIAATELDTFLESVFEKHIIRNKKEEYPAIGRFA